MKIDLHVHTSISSDCSILQPEELLDFLARDIVDGVCVTEHNTLEGGLIFKEMASAAGVSNVYVGMEISHNTGHFLTYNFFEEGDYYDWPIDDLIDYVHSMDGIIIPAHPFRRGFKNLALTSDILSKFDALEVLNGNCVVDENQRSFSLAQSLGLTKIAGSDAHSADMLGQYFTIFPHRPRDESELAALIKEGAVMLQ